MMRNSGAECSLEIRKCIASDYIVEFKMSNLSFNEAVEIGAILESLRVKHAKDYEEVD